MPSKKQIADFQNKIFSWWETNKRDLPWRHTHNPYHIVVSELMLQQTQASRVIPKYLEFLDKFPNVQTLAQSSAADVIKLWQGLGYNRRALHLLKLAQIIGSKRFPDAEMELLNLPGIGLYTARAIQVFAFKKDVAAVDTNIRQIIEQEFFQSVPQNPKKIQEIADQLVPIGKSWHWHQALMDYGAIALVRIKRPKTTAIKFKDSNRFLRGRIVDMLRSGPKSIVQIQKVSIEQFGRSTDQINSCLNSLLKDKLIVSRSEIYSLP